jgi:hypothetical protein
MTGKLKGNLFGTGGGRSRRVSGATSCDQERDENENREKQTCTPIESHPDRWANLRMSLKVTDM